MSFSIHRRSWLQGAAATSALTLTGAVTGAFHSLTAYAVAAKPAFGTWGIDLATFDRTVEPGDDYFRYVNGAWLDKTAIPPDRTRWGAFDVLAKPHGSVNEKSSTRRQGNK